MNPMRWAAAAVATVTVAGSGCSDDGTVTVAVELTTSTRPGLDPFAADVGLEAIQIIVEGAGRGEEAIASVAPGERQAVISGLPLDGDEVTLNVRAEGLDAQGNLVAFGRAPEVIAAGDVEVGFPLRRNLAYVTHQINQRQMTPEQFVYVLDLGTRAIVEKVRIQGTAPIGTWVTARGGDALLVTYRDQGLGYLGILSAADHSWRRIELPVAQRVALGVEGVANGVVGGGGKFTFVDLDEGTVTGQFPPGDQLVGGTVIDGVIAGDGRTALFVLGGVAQGSVAFVDLEAQTVEPLDVILQPSGVALSPDGRLAFVTSGVEAAVAAVDLRSGRVDRSNGFARPVGRAAYSENMQAVLALDADPSARRVLALLPRANCPEDVNQQCGQALPLSDATETTELPVDLAADGAGRQLLVIGTGSSTAGAGLTLIETFAGVRQLPVGARTLYPGDPDDTFRQGRDLIGRERYQPSSVAIIYGR